MFVQKTQIRNHEMVVKTKAIYFNFLNISLLKIKLNKNFDFYNKTHSCTTPAIYV